MSDKKRAVIAGQVDAGAKLVTILRVLNGGQGYETLMTGPDDGR